jgi:polysaccharide pyruvyl transferase WcaK-like protein
MSEPRRILVCSSAILTSDGSVGNVGDEALTETLASALRGRVPNAIVEATLHPGASGLRVPDGRVAVRPLRQLIAAVRRADVVIAGGGTLLQEENDRALLKPAGGLLRYIAVVALTARLLGKPFGLVAVGAENLDSRAGRLMTRLIVAAAASTSVRDARSARLLEGVTGKAPLVVADPMFLLNGHGARSEGRSDVCVNLRKDAGPETMAALAEAITPVLGNGGRLVLVSMDRRVGEDDDALAQFRALLPSSLEVDVIAPSTPWREVLNRFERAQLCVGMRLHFLIFAAVAGAPVVALTTSEKTVSFVEELQAGHARVGDAEGIHRAVAEATAVSAGRLDGLRHRAESIVSQVESLCA